MPQTNIGTNVYEHQNQPPCPSCGKQHATFAARVSFGNGTAGHVLNDWLREGGYTQGLAVADANTEQFARNIITEVDCLPVQLFVYNNKSLIPDEAAIGALLFASDPVNIPANAGKQKPVLLAVGAGTINDLARYAAHRLGWDYYIAATAASMDGYASSVTPLISAGLKKTFPAVAARGIIADAAILNTAPSVMAAAGYGDILGKWTSTHDWELEYIVTGDAAHYCDLLAREMRAAAASCTEWEIGSPARIMEALLDTGGIMCKAGHSRPASGSEHHLSHFWENQAIARGEVPALHGVKVGIATLAVLRVNEWLLAETPDLARAGISQAQWDGIAGAIRRNLPPGAMVEAALKRMGCPVSPAEINISRDDFLKGVLNAQWVRPRYTTWKLADALGVLPAYGERLAAKYYG
jgi:glycerol-1-phosphate dehydrogenase [NAD(P)+]